MHPQRIHTVTLTDTEGKSYLFASPDGKSYLEVRDITGVTPEGLREAIDNGKTDPETGRCWLPMTFDRNFFRYAKRSDSIATVTYTDPEPVA